MAIVDDDVAADDGLQTACLLSYLTDRRAEADDVIPDGTDDRRGWLGDEFLPVQGDRYGSRRWLLDRSKRTEDMARRVEEIDREALAWMIEDRVTEKIDELVEFQGDMLATETTIHRPTGEPVTFRFSHVWNGEAA